MTPEDRYIKIKELFLLVADLPKAQQSAYLQQTCGDHPSLIVEIEEMLLTEEQEHPIDHIPAQIGQAMRHALPAQNLSESPLSDSLEYITQCHTNIPHDDDPYASNHPSLFATATHKSRATIQTSTEKADLSLGTLIQSRYQIESELGRGGFSIVYLATDLQLNNRPVVIKVMMSKVEDSSTSWKESKFFAEVRALTKINHPHVVSIFDYGLLSNGKPFFVMELIPGESLRALINRNRMGLMPATIIRIIKQISNALRAAHALGIYHRDLKPENIMVRQLNEDQEHVKVIDFGIATVKQSANAPTITKSIVGTPAYMAPEQLEGKPSAASDIYALGIVAYEMLTGRPPFNITIYKSLKEVFTNLKRLQQQGTMATPSQLSPHLPPAIDKVILKAMAFQAKDRYAQADELAKALERALGTEADEEIAWEQLCLLAQTTDCIWFIDERLRDNIKTTGFSTINNLATYVHKLHSKLSVVLDLKVTGHLLLLAQESNNKILCLCPSRYVARDQLHKYPVLLPTEGLIYQNLPLAETRGRKQLLAIISQTPLAPTWEAPSFPIPAPRLTMADIHKLREKLSQLPPHLWTAFYTSIDII